MTKPVGEVNLPGIKKHGSGKVREIFDLGDRFLIVATDRISAYDYILPTLIPDKGKILNKLSVFWFRTGWQVPNLPQAVPPARTCRP